MFGVWSVEDTKKEYDKRAACVERDMEQFTAEVDIFFYIFGLPDKYLLYWMIYLVFGIVYLVFVMVFVMVFLVFLVVYINSRDIFVVDKFVMQPISIFSLFFLAGDMNQFTINQLICHASKILTLIFLIFWTILLCHILFSLLNL